MRIESFQDPRDNGHGGSVHRKDVVGNSGGDSGKNSGKDAGWRNKRLIDLGSILVLLGVMVAGYYYFNRPAPPTQTSFIVPSQHVHW